MPLLKYATTCSPSVTGDGLLPLALRCLPRAGLKMLPPQFLALHVVADDTVLAINAARDKNLIAPYSRRRATLTGQVDLPRHALGIREFDRVVAVNSYTRPQRPAPLRPILLLRTL